MTTTETADIFADVDRLRLKPNSPLMSAPVTPSSGKSTKIKQIKGAFLKGPIPLRWLSVVSAFRGKAPLAVALALWFEVGRRNSKEVRLTSAVLKRFSVSRKSKYEGLAAMEKAGLIFVKREGRKNPIVTILDSPCDADDKV
jgi:hypothetical protein